MSCNDIRKSYYFPKTSGQTQLAGASCPSFFHYSPGKGNVVPGTGVAVLQTTGRGQQVGGSRATSLHLQLLFENLY